MNIIVPVKQVPETDMKPRIAGDSKSLELANVKMIMNPFDEFAVEEALTLRDSSGDGEVTVITFGDDESVQALRTGLAMGANNAVRIKDDGAEGSDSRAVASLLAEAVKERSYDLIICGKLAVGGDNNQVPQMLATRLGIPMLPTVDKLEIADGKAKGYRQIEGKTEVYEVSLPAVISVDKGLNEPRYPKLKGIMAAKRAKIEEIAAGDLSVDSAILGEDGSQFELLSIELPPERGEGKIIEVGDEPDAAVDQLIDWLKNEAKVI